MTVRVRFAPSPTGPLHLGNARTALFNWLFARAHGGQFILRIEDTDRERSRPEWEAAIVSALRWLGLDWDEGPDKGGPSGPYRQSERLARYQGAASRLLRAERAYWCFCDPHELENRRRHQLLRGKPPRYDGRCGRLPQKGVGARLEAGQRAALRVRVADGPVMVRDLVKGTVEFKGEDLDDFVLMRSDGQPTYNFAAVVDDSSMAISHVIRGDDHLPNTPRQIALYQALGVEPPAFAHLPLIHGSGGAPLSKRHGAVSVGEHRAAGMLPEALVNYLALLGWSAPTEEGEVHTLETLSRLFSLDRVSTAPARFDPDRLVWFSRQHLRRVPLDRLLSEIPADIQVDREIVRRALQALRNDAAVLPELIESALAIGRTTDLDRGSLPLSPVDRTVLGAVRSALEGLALSTEAEAQALLSRLEKSLGFEKRALMHPIRVALTGVSQGPAVATLLWILGSEEARRRVDRVLALLVSS